MKPITRKTVVDFMQEKGWSRAAAYGAASNIYQECTFRPNLYGDRGKAYGLCQWQGVRQEQFAKVYGKPITEASAEEQLAFMDWELRNTERKAGEKLRAAHTAYEAGAVFSLYYERPKRKEMELHQRGRRAQDWYDEDGRLQNKETDSAAS
jgi:hypothetical protein